MSTQLKREVTEFQRGDDEFPPEDAAKFVAWFAEKYQAIPVEHRASATVEIDTWDDGWGAGGPLVRISYERPETDDERRHREREEGLAAERRERDDLRKLHELARRLGKVVR